MNREEIDKLIGGYATDTLTPEERQALFAAALEDQDLFNTLMAEQPLKELLDDRETRGYLLAVLDEQDAMTADREGESLPRPKTQEFRVGRAPTPSAPFWKQPITWGLTASAAIILTVSGVLWQQKSQEAPPSAQTAENRAPAPATPTPSPITVPEKETANAPAQSKKEPAPEKLTPKSAPAKKQLDASRLIAPAAPPPPAIQAPSADVAAPAKPAELDQAEKKATGSNASGVPAPAQVATEAAQSKDKREAELTAQMLYRQRLLPGSGFSGGASFRAAPAVSAERRAKTQAIPLEEGQVQHPGIELQLERKLPSGEFAPVDAAQPIAPADEARLAIQANQPGYIYVAQYLPDGSVKRLFTFGPLAAFSTARTVLPAGSVALAVVHSMSPLSDEAIAAAANDPAARPDMKTNTPNAAFAVKRQPNQGRPISVRLDIQRR